MDIKKKQMIFPDSYRNIHGYATEFKDLLLKSAKGIVKSNPDQEPIVIYMDVKNITELIRRGGSDTVYLAAVLGIEHTDGSKEGELTISLLCTDEAGNILPNHINGELAGEEVWPYRRLISDFLAALPTPK